MPNTTGIITTHESNLVVEWKISYFSFLEQSVHKWYMSDEFSFDGERWRLQIFTNGSSGRDCSEYMHLWLVKCSSTPSASRLPFSPSLKTVKGNKYNEQHGTIEFDTHDTLYSFYRFISISELSSRRSELVPGDVLTVIFIMKGSTSAGSNTGKEHQGNFENAGVNASTQTEEDNEACASGFSTSSHQKKLHDDLKDLFLKKEDSDIIIRVKGSEIPVHRLILKTRSPVFASTFQHNMTEKATGVVEIEDCDSSPFMDFLRYIYYGDVGMISQENVFHLFRLADKYEVLDLRATCLEFINQNITVATFCETITLALQHTETELIASATDFFVRNAEEILQTVKWQTFAAENPTQSNELMIKLVKWFKHSNV